MARLEHVGYGQLEINNCAFRRDGRVEAQLPLKKADFEEAGGAENGMIVYINNVGDEDHKRGYLTLDAEDGIMGIIYSAEKTYYPMHSGLKDYFNEIDGFLPRVGMIDEGDKFTTNTVDLEGEFEDVEVGDEFGPKDGVLTAGAAEGDFKFIVIEKTTMPDGQKALKFQARKA